jgi:uncharacterized membrane protein YdbT with pleckstrin-like domain
MRYVSRVLQPGETIVYTTKLHWLIYAKTIFLLIISVILLGVGLSINDNQNMTVALGIGAVVFALVALFTGLRAFIRRAATELAVTDHRVIYKTGLLSRHTIEMNRDKVESVDIDQTLPGRIFGYGTIIVRGTGGSLEPIRDIGDPLTFRSFITAGPSSRATQD